MKKSGYLILGFALGVIGCYFYLSSPHKGETNDDVVVPQGLIRPLKAKTLSQAFNVRHQLISDSILKRPDNRSSWYSLETLRNYLTYAEKQAKDSGYTMNGVRIYLGAHKNVDSLAGYTTMFFIPTGTRNTSEGNSTLLPLAQTSSDLINNDGLNDGDPGKPPSANYPQ